MFNLLKMSLKRIVFTACCAAVVFPVFTQPKYCGTTEMQQKLFSEHPDLKPLIEQKQDELEKFTQFFAQSQSGQRTGTVYIIPIVFHILHDYGPEYISDAQVKDAVRILNEDFRKLNPDTASIVSAFQSIAADCEIEFRLAQKDPNGNCTNGITRIYTQETYVGDDGSKLNQWDRNRYINVWVVNSIQNGAAGWTYLPSSVIFFPGNDGIIILHNYIGSIGTGNPSTSRALTHEVGHYLNLLHLWGDTNDPGVSTNCNGDDGVSDTPNTIGWQSCSLSGTSCSSVDNVQNYMEYSFCENMFTQGQATRMRGALNSSIAGRNNLWKTSNLQFTGTDGNDILCAADFNTDYTSICTGQDVQFNDASYNGQTSWQWTFENGNPSSSTNQNPAVVYWSPGTHDVGLAVGNGVDPDVNSTKTGYITVYPSPGKYMPYSESFEGDAIPNDDWEIFNPDNTNYKWLQSTIAGYTGTKSLKMNNFSNPVGNKDDVISGPLDLSTLSAATVTFKVAFAQITSSNNDKLKLYASNNCGQTWALRWAKTGNLLASVSPQSAPFTPSTTSEWQEFTVILTSSYLTENLRLKFVFENDGGNNLYIDDINISGAFNTVPLLVWPSDGAQNVGDNITLDWKSVGDVDSYEYQLDTDPGFSSGNLIGSTKTYIDYSPDNTDTEFQASNLTHSATYYWRVRTTTGGTNSAWSDVWSFTVSANGVGLDELALRGSQFTVFPNPNNGVFEIATAGNGSSKISIYNVLGEEIHSINLINPTNLLRVDISQQPKGVYFLRCSINEHSYTQKIIVK